LVRRAFFELHELRHVSRRVAERAIFCDEVGVFDDIFAIEHVQGKGDRGKGLGKYRKIQ